MVRVPTGCGSVYWLAAGCRGFRRLALRNVLAHSHGEDRLAGGVAHERSAEPHPNHRAILAHVAFLIAVIWRLTTRCGSKDLPITVAVIGVGQFREAEHTHFRRRKSSNFAIFVVEAQQISVAGVDLNDPDRGNIENSAQLLFAGTTPPLPAYAP